MFRCKDKNSRVLQVTWLRINAAYLPVITVCRQNMYIPSSPDSIPNVTGLDLEADGTSISISWNASDIYFTEIQYRLDDGEWEVLELIEIGEDSI